jgi:hypothetical protein
MTEGRTRRVFVEMLREEWRMHNTLFRGSHFASFPLLIALFTTGAVWVLGATGTAVDTLFAGLHALVFVFGLHTGSIGFVGRDTLRNLLGDLTLLVFSARTLPLSQNRLLGIFVIKDVVYYAILFLVPMTLGTVVAAFGTGSISGGAAAVGLGLRLWATLTLSFVLGLGTTIAALGLTGRGVPGLALLVAGGVALGAAWTAGVDLVAVTPYGVFQVPTALRIGGAVALVVAVLLVGAVTFEGANRRSVRTLGPSFRRWWRVIGDPIATKTFLDVHRSSGGFGKVLFSAAVLFGVTASLVDLAGQITGVAPSVGISFGAILGLSGFTTYNWLTQSDDIDAYLVHPVSVATVFGAKFRAFLFLGPIVGLVFYVGALAWRGAPLGEALVGAVLLSGVACYIFGVTVYLTGLSPNEFLFDTVLFAVFGVAMVAPLVPILVVGFALAPLSTVALGALGAGGVVLGVAGIALYRLSLPKWSHRYQQA